MTRRKLSAGLEWYAGATLCAVYTDRGISSGMWRGMDAARDADVPIEERRLFSGSVD